MKAIMMSIRPQYVAKILNGEKTIEIRKKFPKDYVGWVYIYCTKDKKYANLINRGGFLTGMVVARFWCDKVEEILLKENGNFYTNFLSNRKLLTQSCLTQNELRDYIGGNWKKEFDYWYGGYAIHITKLEIFDKPKEISEFMKVSCKGCPFENTQTCHNDIEGKLCRITRAPQNWCYIEL